MAGGVPVTAEITTLGPNDPYPTGIANLLKGGVHSIEDPSKFYKVTWERRTRGTLCVVIDDGIGLPALYWFIPPFNATQAQLEDDQYWSRVPLGLSINGVLSLKGFLDATTSPFPLADGTGTDSDTWIVDVGATINLSTMFGGIEKTLQVGDYVVYNSGQWHVVGNGILGTTWNTIPGKPATFPPTSHSHTISDISDFPDLSQYITVSRISNSIEEGTVGTNLSTIDAIKTYVAERINGIDIPTVDLTVYYTKTQVNSLIENVEPATIYTKSTISELATITPKLKDQCYVSENSALYQYELVSSNPTWVIKYYSDKNRTNSEIISSITSELGYNTWKNKPTGVRVHVATISNITLSDFQIIDNLDVGDGINILVKNQTTTSENGIYLAKDVGAWEKLDLDYNNLLFYVEQGDTNEDRIFFQENNDTNDLNFTVVNSTDIINISRVDNNLVITRKSGSSYNISLDDLGGGSGGHIIQNDGSALPQRANIDFVGSNIEATDDPSNNKTIITSDRPSANQVPFTPSGNIVATNTQAAIIELDTEKAALGESNTWGAQQNFDNIVVLNALDDIGVGAYKIAVIRNSDNEVRTLDLVPAVQADIDSLETSLLDGVVTAGNTLAKLYALIQGVQSIDTTYTDIAARDADTGSVSTGQYVFVTDASADGTVTSGWAIYRWNGSSYDKISEQENLDIVLTALTTSYDNTDSGLTATNVKAAIDELKTNIDNLVFNPVVKSTVTLSSNAALALDLATFDFDAGHTLNANITELQLSNGVVGNTYTVRFIQGTTGGTLTLADNWVKNTVYSINDRVLFIDSTSGDVVDYSIWKCNTGHTSDNTGTYGDYTVDIANWTLETKVKGGVKPILSNEESLEDFMEITVLASGLYRIKMDY